jgi:hypothetical protein
MLQQQTAFDFQHLTWLSQPQLELYHHDHVVVDICIMDNHQIEQCYSSTGVFVDDTPPLAESAMVAVVSLQANLQVYARPMGATVSSVRHGKWFQGVIISDMTGNDVDITHSRRFHILFTNGAENFNVEAADVCPRQLVSIAGGMNTRYQGYKDCLSAHWTAFKDAEVAHGSIMIQYEHRIYDENIESFITPWRISMLQLGDDTATSMTLCGLSLRHGHNYSAHVRGTNVR